MNNRAQSNSKERYLQKVNIQSQHKFCLTIENIPNLTDWVTENMFHALASGCVPVYFGAPNIKEYMPCDNCFIDGYSFPSMKALADYLIFLDNNPSEYNKYLAYKEKPLVLKPMMQASKRFIWCAVCAMVAEMKAGRVKPPKMVFNLKQQKWEPVNMSQ